MHVLVNNAATMQPLGSLVEVDWEVATVGLQLNLIAPAALSALLLPAMLDAGWGRIVNVSSGVVARPGSMRGGNVYAAGKAGLEAHTLNLAAELAGTGVTANVYRPGMVDTAMQASVREHPKTTGTQALVEHFRRTYAGGGLLTPDHSAARLVVRLGSDDNGSAPSASRVASSLGSITSVVSPRSPFGQFPFFAYPASKSDLNALTG